MKTRIELGKFLRKKREAAGVTQAQVAEVLGYASPQLVSNVERGIVFVPQAGVRKWARTIGVAPLTLFRLYIRVKNAEAEKKFLKKE